MAVADNIQAFYEDFTDQTSVTVTHNLNRQVHVQVNVFVGGVLTRVRTKVERNSLNQFTVSFGSYTRSGKIVYE